MQTNQMFIVIGERFEGTVAVQKVSCDDDCINKFQKSV